MLISKPHGSIQWKDLLEETSYRFTFLFGFAGIIFSLLFLTFIARTFGDRVSESMLPYGGDYFAFVVVGIAIYSFLGAALQRLAQVIRQAQVMGTLEALLSTRTSLATIVLCLTNDFIWWIPFGLYLYDSWPAFRRDLAETRR